MTAHHSPRAQFYHKACLIRSKSGQNDSYFWKALNDEMSRPRWTTVNGRRQLVSPGDGASEVIVIDDSDEEDQANNNSAAQVQNQDMDDEDDDDIVCEETLTNAQVIQQKFDRAAANGEIVPID